MYNDQNFILHTKTLKKKFQSSTVITCLNWNLPKHLSVIKQVYQIVAYSYEERACNSENEGTTTYNNVSEFHR